MNSAGKPFCLSKATEEKYYLPKEVPMRTVLFPCLFLLFANNAHTAVIDFEDLTRYLPGTDMPLEDIRPVTDGYMGFNWHEDRTADSRAGNPSCATGEAFMWMGGTDCTYLYATEFSMVSETRPFHIRGLDVGSYFFEDQVVFAAGLLDNRMGYFESFLLDDAFRLTRFQLGSRNMDHFALWAGGGVPLEDFLEDFPHTLCIDNIEYEWSEPVPEPSTLLILGTGMAGLAGLIRKYRKGGPDGR